MLECRFREEQREKFESANPIALASPPRNNAEQMSDEELTSVYAKLVDPVRFYVDNPPYE